jgi:hypothetical protein
MCATFLAAAVGGSLADVLAGECCVKLKDYQIPQYGLNDGASPPNPVRTELASAAPDHCEVQFGQHFTLLQPLYTPQPETWKIPRWVVAMVGLFFGSAAVLTVATCVVLLRDQKPAPAQPLAVPTAPVAMTAAVAATPPRPSSSPPTTRPAAVHDDSAPARRIIVSRHPSAVRRQLHGPRRIASRSTSSSVALQETEPAPRRPPQDPLDKLLGESSLAGAP